MDQIDVEIDKFLREHHSLVPHFSILLLYFLLDVARKLAKWNGLITFYAVYLGIVTGIWRRSTAGTQKLSEVDELTEISERPWERFWIELSSIDS